MKWLSHIALILFNIIFPKHPDTVLLEAMSIEEFVGRVPPAPAPPHDIHALFAYKHPLVRHAIWELKYRRNTTIAELFANCIHEHLLESLSDHMLFEHNIPLIIPVPLSKRRLRERGYNQIDLVLKHLDDSFEYRTGILTKTKHTEKQTNTSREKRLSNLRNVFEATSAVHGRTIIVIDDVCTTGATLKEIRRELNARGASKVILLAFAH